MVLWRTFRYIWKTMAMYFTDREHGPRPRTREEIGGTVWGALYSLIAARLNDFSIGYRFPEQCPDGAGPCGGDRDMFELVAKAEIPELAWPLDPDRLPPTPAILDLLGFVASTVGEPIRLKYHPFFDHYHLNWDRAAGLQRFIVDVNRVFSRSGIAFEMNADGEIRRLVPEPLRQEIAHAVFRTSDDETNRLLELARALITSPHLDRRKDALEKLWDAFERLKTLEGGADKRAMADALLDRAAQTPRFRELIGAEAKALTVAGNTFRIRHSETSQELLSAPEQVDYFFHRMFAFIRLILKTTGRGS